MSVENPTPRRIYRVDLGMRVTLDLVSIDGLDRMEVEIVPDQFADIRMGFLGISTPLAKSILNHTAGETVPFMVEGTDEVRIIQVLPSGKAPPKEVADRLQQVLRSAIDQSDRTNAVVFASSFSGKWGDYDPTGFTDDSAIENEKDEDSATSD